MGPIVRPCTHSDGVKARVPKTKAIGIKTKAVVHKAKAKAHKDKAINRDQGLRQGTNQHDIIFHDVNIYR